MFIAHKIDRDYLLKSLFILTSFSIFASLQKNKEMTEYDVAIIGSGPGGYVAAIRAAQLGKKVAIIEKYSTLGGTCLNVGCIPSKALLDSSEHFHNANKSFAEHGIVINEPTVNLEQMIGRKQKVVDQTCDGVAYLMKKNKIDVYEGLGSFVDANTINIAMKDGDEKIKATNIIIATGSKPPSFHSPNLIKNVSFRAPKL